MLVPGQVHWEKEINEERLIGDVQKDDFFQLIFPDYS